MTHTSTRIVWTLLQCFAFLIDAYPVFAREKERRAVNELPQVSTDDADDFIVVVNITTKDESTGQEVRTTVPNSKVSITNDYDYLDTGARNFWVDLESKIAQLGRVNNKTYPDTRIVTCTTETKVGDNIILSRTRRKDGIKLSIQAMDDHPVIHDIELKGAQVGDRDIDMHSYNSHPFYGVMLAVSAAFLVGMSFIFQKKGLINIEAKKKKASFVRTGSLGEFAYLGQWMWWCGMLAMALGEVLNFVAYSIAPAILVTPLGALRVIVSAILSAMFLGERLNVHGKIGVLLSLVGSVMVIIHAPRHEKVQTFEQVVSHFTDTTFVLYCIILLGLTAFLIFHAGPKYGRTNIMVYISVCNIVGALCVLCGKGLGISLKDIGREGEAVYLHPIFWLLLIGNVVGIVTQIVYLNKSLAVFDTSMITPIKYVFTNVFLVVGSILLFQEFAYMSLEDVIGITCGFATVVTGVVLLNLFKRSKSQSESAQM